MAATLTQTSIIARKIIRYTIYAVILIIIGRVTIKTGVRVYRYFFPPPPPPATVAFGKLPSLPFPEEEFKKNLTFSLETPEGDLPKLLDQAKVYFMPKTSPSLLSLDVAKSKAKLLRFSPEAKKISETNYLFSHPRAPSSLKMNIVSGSFSISFDLRSEPSVLQSRPPAPEAAASIARSYLSSAGLLPEDLSGPTTHEFLRIEENEFIPALSLSEANFIKVNFYRREFDDLSSLTADPEEANVWLLISGAAAREKQIIAAEYNYLPVDAERFATYPIKKASTAWEELQAGSAYIASPKDVEEGEFVTIRRVYLAYYDPPTAAEFYQPIIVFEGNDDFVAYVPAVTSEYYGE